MAKRENDRFRPEAFKRFDIPNTDPEIGFLNLVDLKKLHNSLHN